jgi:hypothetical protein
METSEPKRILVVANRTVAAPRLIDEIRRRAHAGPCDFELLIPDGKANDWTLEAALRVLRPAARGRIAGLAGGADPFDSVVRRTGMGDVDEIIISTLPKSPRWLRRDLVRRVERLGLPVTAIVPGCSRPSNKEAFKMMVGFGSGGGGAPP